MNSRKPIIGLELTAYKRMQIVSIRGTSGGQGPGCVRSPTVWARLGIQNLGTKTLPRDMTHVSHI